MTFWLAPLHGITHYLYRNCLSRHTTSIKTAITPFFSIQERSKLNFKKYKDLLPENNRTLEVIPQLIGNNPHHFLDTVEKLAEFGYRRFNWNLGCPAAQIVRKQRGCGLLPYPEKIEEVIRLVTQKTSYKISLKIRLGYKKAEESEEVLKRMNHYPIDFIVLHPRLGIQEYEGVPNYDLFEERMKLSNHRMIYNGDINSVEDFIKLKNRFTSVNDWMLGRGILQNPFLVEQIEAEMNGISYNPNSYPLRMYEFYKELVNDYLTYGNEKGTLAHLKELWHYLAISHKLTSEEKQNLLRINDLSQFIKKTEEYILQNRSY